MAERPILKSEREAKQAEAAQTPKRDVPKPIHIVCPMALGWI